MRTKIKTISTYFMAVFNLATGIITIISGIKSFTAKPIFIAGGTIFILIGCFFVGLIIYKIVKNNAKNMTELSIGFDILTHNFEYECGRLKELTSTVSNPEMFKKEILESSHNLILIIQRAIHNALNKNVRVCIKMFKDNSTENLFTYTRDTLSINQSYTKEHNETIEAKNNSDFSDIISGNLDIFIGENLKKLYKEKKYFNSHPDFHYQSTVVVPIRASDSNGDYINIGFLCVDSEEQALFSKESTENCISFIKGSAHIIYILISQGNEYYNDIKEKAEVTANA